MKKITFLFLAIFATANIYSQNYNISFAGTGASTTVDSVKVENLMQGTTVKLLGTDILHLIGPNSINSIYVNNDNFQVFPNPMQGQAEISFYAKQAGNAKILIYDIAGKKVLQIDEKLLQGTQKYQLTGLKQGVYFINISGENYNYNTKLISLNTAQTEVKIEFINSEKPEIIINKYKSSKAIIDMPYTVGNRILLRAYSGNNSTIVTDVPTSSKTITFTFAACTDFDNNNYPIVKIGLQTWMAENLKTTHYRNGDEITNVTDGNVWKALTTGAYCNYDNNTSIADIYGKLYNFYAVTDSRNLCPAGWHSSTNDEWTVLLDNLGGEDIAGDKLKETGTSHWSNPNSGATNEVGFTATPCKMRNGSSGGFATGESAYFGTATEISSTKAWAYYISYIGAFIYSIEYYDKQYGLSVRCVSDASTPASLPTVTTTTTVSITATTATSGGNVTDNGGAAVTERGICYSTTTNPTTANNKITSGTGIGLFTANISGLSISTTYYIRAYATNSAGTAYGNQVTFTTLSTGIPSLTTTAATSITTNSSISGGNVISDGGLTVSARGICYATTISPTTSNSTVSSGSGTGSFTSNITGLTAGTTYYVRAYATNSFGTAYGNQISFTTTAAGQVPILTTSTATSITSSTATSGGIISSNGGSAITSRGICYSLTANPTTANNTAVSGSTVNTFSADIAGLVPNTMYYVRAYAVNSVGTGYGNQISFTTLSASTSGATVTDIDGNVYDTITIGTQTWMKQNLNVTKYRNGDSIPNSTNNNQWFGLTTGVYCNYNNDVNNATTYGRIYNGYSVADNRKLCPTGWHIPTDAEMLILATYLGGTNIAAGTLKETGTVHWTSPNTGATNISGFTSLPGGNRFSAGDYHDIYNIGGWWSATTITSTNGTNMRNIEMNYNNTILERNTYQLNHGFSVRCLRD